jgi:CHAD domain-containing protein
MFMAKAKEIEGLDYGAGAGDGVRLILRSRFEEMRGYRDAALDWSNINGVHDMRVASRRLRSALRDFTLYLRERKLLRLNKALKKIADMLGAVRDQDVAIMALGTLASKAPSEVSAGIEQFANERRLKRDIARSELARAITDEALAKLEKEFNSALEDGLKNSRKRKTGGSNRKPVERLSCRDAGREVITVRFRELQDLSASLYRPHKVKSLHDMRIAAKRLRYAIELFAPCWTKPLASSAKEIAKMQTSLGELHDCDVWIDEIGTVLRETEWEAASGVAGAPDDDKVSSTASTGDAGSDEAETRNRSAAIWLLDYFVKERTQHYRDALARWHDWEEADFHARLAALIQNEMSASDFTPAALTPAEAVAADIEER